MRGIQVGKITGITALLFAFAGCAAPTSPTEPAYGSPMNMPIVEQKTAAQINEEEKREIKAVESTKKAEYDEEMFLLQHSAFLRVEVVGGQPVPEDLVLWRITSFYVDTYDVGDKIIEMYVARRAVGHIDGVLVDTADSRSCNQIIPVLNDLSAIAINPIAAPVLRSWPKGAVDHPPGPGPDGYSFVLRWNKSPYTREEVWLSIWSPAVQRWFNSMTARMEPCWTRERR